MSAAPVAREASKVLALGCALDYRQYLTKCHNLKHVKECRKRLMNFNVN